MKPLINDNGIQYLFVLFIITCLLFTLLYAGCNQTPNQAEPPSQIEPTPTKTPTESASPEPPPTPPRGAIIVKLSFSEPPVLGKPVQLLATFTIREEYKKDTTDTVARISLDEGFELVDGNLEWKGDLLRGSSVEIKATVRAIKTGERKISAKGEAPFTSGFTELYAYVSEDSATVSDIPLRPEKTPSPEPAEPPEGTESPTPPVPPVERSGPEPPIQQVEPGQEPSPILSDYWCR
jgi:hypothetical protein